MNRAVRRFCGLDAREAGAAWKQFQTAPVSFSLKKRPDYGILNVYKF